MLTYSDRQHVSRGVNIAGLGKEPHAVLVRHIAIAAGICLSVPHVLKQFSDVLVPSQMQQLCAR